MSGLTLLLACVFVVVCLAAGRHGRDRWYLILAVVAGAGIVGVVLTGSVHATDWQLAVLDAAIIGASLVVAADGLGLGAAVDHRLGIGRRRRGRSFDRQLYPIVDAFHEILSRYPGSEPIKANLAWRDAVLGHGPQLVAGLRDLEPPDAGWRKLRDDLVALYEAMITFVGTDPQPPADRDALTVRARELERRYRELRRHPG